MRCAMKYPRAILDMRSFSGSIKLRLPAQEYRRCRGRLTGSGTAAGAVAATDGGPVGAGVRHACWLGDAGTD